MRNYRADERRRNSRDDSSKTHIRFIDDIVEDAQNKYRRRRR